MKPNSMLIYFFATVLMGLWLYALVFNQTAVILVMLVLIALGCFGHTDAPW